MRKLMLPVCLLALCMLLLSLARAEQMYLQASCVMEFPEAMLNLQQNINQDGFTVLRVQHVDKGLKTRGYETEPYKVVFFGKADEIDFLRREYPVLIPFLPLSITIHREGQATIISTLAPKYISQIVPDDRVASIFELWQQHMEQILKRYATCQLNS